jgi:hypothetical protein
MTASTSLSRRGLFRTALLGLAWIRRALAAPSLDAVLGIDRLAAVASHARWYRVQARIKLLSVPLYTQDNAGGAFAMFEEACSGGVRTTALQFSAGSWPERLRGFNRFGMTQEAVRLEDGVPVQSAYLSFMTTSSDANFEQARKLFDDRSASLPVVAGHGVATRAGYAAALDRLSAPASYTWCDCARLIDEIRSRLSPAVDRGERGAVVPFLHAVRHAMRSGEASGSQPFVHNGRIYRLETRTVVVRELNVMTGRISGPAAERESEFRLWFDPRDSSGLPLRIEFRPRSFLHLVFDYDPAASGPAFPSLMAKEQA